jgi:hypothetical protein
MKSRLCSLPDEVARNHFNQIGGVTNPALSFTPR